MSEIKALDKLREYVDKQREEYNNHNVSFVWQLYTIADEIEAEIADNYMRLPCDADGVPIHGGDRLECHANGYEGTFTVFAIGNNTVVGNHDIEWIRDNPGKWFHVALSCHHVKPRTLENVLTEMLDRNTDGVGYREFNGDFQAFVSHYADEIRELLGGDVE